MIKAYLKGEQTNWDLNLGCLAGAYRATPHESTGMSPNLLVFGREARLPAEIMFGSGAHCVGTEVASYGEYVNRLKNHMQRAHDVAREYLSRSAERQKQSHDARVSFHRYKVGDLIWYLTGKGQLDVTPKLRVPYEGPFLVLKRLTDVTYLIQFDAKGHQKVVHHDKLKHYEGDKRLKWAKLALKV
jgi:hypothetical protein